MVNKSSKKTRRVLGRVFLLIIVLVILYFVIRPLAQIDYRHATLIKESKRLDGAIEDLTTKVEAVKSELATASTDAGIEKQARERLQMVNSGEIVYICKDSEGNDITTKSNLVFKNAQQEDKPSAILMLWDWVLSLFR